MGIYIRFGRVEGVGIRLRRGYIAREGFDILLFIDEAGRLWKEGEYLKEDLGLSSRI